MTETRSSTQAFRFMDLPKELRLMVYERIPRQIIHTRINLQPKGMTRDLYLFSSPERALRQSYVHRELSTKNRRHSSAAWLEIGSRLSPYGLYPAGSFHSILWNGLFAIFSTSCCATVARMTHGIWQRVRSGTFWLYTSQLMCNTRITGNKLRLHNFRHPRSRRI
jgi:hypothetical protein